MNSEGKHDAAVAEFSKRISGFEGTKKLSDREAFAHLKTKKFEAATADATAYIKWCTTCGLDVSGSVYYIRACAQYEGLQSPKKEALSPKDLDCIVGDLKEAIRRSPDDSLSAKGLLAHLRVDPSLPLTPSTDLTNTPTTTSASTTTQQPVKSVLPRRGCADFVHNSITMLRTYSKQFGKEAMAAYEALSPKERHPPSWGHIRYKQGGLSCY